MTQAKPSKTPYKRPRSVLVVIHTLDGWCLLLERTKPSGFWQSVTGSLNNGENPRHAAEREVWEETGLACAGRLRATRIRRRFAILGPWRSRYAPGVHENEEMLYYLTLARRRLIRIQPAEHARYRWLRLAQAAALASSWSNREAIERLDSSA